MLAEIREKSQITIPGALVKKLNISKGDMFDIVEKDGGIFLCPVVVYPKDKITEIAKIIKGSQAEIKTQKAFETVEDMFEEMGINLSDV